MLDTYIYRADTKELWSAQVFFDTLVKLALRANKEVCYFNDIKFTNTFTILSPLNLIMMLFQ